MSRLPPFMWALLFLLAAAGASWALGWPPIPWVASHPHLGMAIFFPAAIWCVWGFRTFRLAGAEIDPLAETHAKLIVRGPYRFSRNPMYLGLTVAVLGMALWVGAWPMLAAPPAVFTVAALVHVPIEEKSLRARFGADYQAYAARIRRWI